MSSEEESITQDSIPRQKILPLRAKNNEVISYNLDNSSSGDDDNVTSLTTGRTRSRNKINPKVTSSTKIPKDMPSFLRTEGIKFDVLLKNIKANYKAISKPSSCDSLEEFKVTMLQLIEDLHLQLYQKDLVIQGFRTKMSLIESSPRNKSDPIITSIPEPLLALISSVKQDLGELHSSSLNSTDQIKNIMTSLMEGVKSLRSDINTRETVFSKILHSSTKGISSIVAHISESTALLSSSLNALKNLSTTLTSKMTELQEDIQSVKHTQKDQQDKLQQIQDAPTHKILQNSPTLHTSLDEPPTMLLVKPTGELASTSLRLLISQIPHFPSPMLIQWNLSTSVFSKYLIQ